MGHMGGEEYTSTKRKVYNILRYANKTCKQCNSDKHWTVDCDFLKDFTLKNGIYYPV